MPKQTSGSTNTSGSHGRSASNGSGSHGRSAATLANTESERTVGTEKSSKLRPGAEVEIMSRSAEGWVSAQVVTPEADGKVYVEYSLDGRAHRKSIRSDSQDLRMLQAPCKEKCDALIVSAPAREPSEREALQQLADLQAREQQLLQVQRAPERSTAAVKWARARKIAEGGRSVELWCAEPEHLNGAYVYAPAEGAAQCPPTYRKASHPEKWLYLATTGSWWIGDTDSKSRRYQKGWMRSDAVEPGTLPHVVDLWEAPRSGEWEPQPSARFWLSESVQVAWQKMRVAAFQAPVVSVQGVKDAFVDGLYDFMPGDGSPGEPPSFQHQQRPNVWLFLAGDQRWWIGNASAKDAHDDRGVVHSAAVQPGTHPAEATGWHVRSTKVWEECKAFKVRAVRGALGARRTWERSRSRAQTVQIWGKEYYHGEYVRRASTDGVPTYQYSADPDVWLYLAVDGAWWLSDAECKDLHKARGYMRSDVVEPGTLPQDVEAWKDLKLGSWEINPRVRVLLPAAVGEEWSKAWKEAEEAQVIEIQGVEGPSFNGMYDLLEGSVHEPPVYQHQINQELYLFVASDGRWWVSNAASMRERAPSGRMHSELILPGMLPTHSVLGWHVHNRSSKEWEQQPRIAVS